jgi:flagellar hook-length control protein FliK
LQSFKLDYGTKQGLEITMSSGQVSMLLSSGGGAESVSSALRSASAADNAETDATAAFIADFNAAIAKESSPKAVASQRQLPAALSKLVEPEPELELTAELADELLSTNLLQQIALTHANKNTADAKTSNEQGDSLTEASEQAAGETSEELTLTSDITAVTTADSGTADAEHGALVSTLKQGGTVSQAADPLNGTETSTATEKSAAGAELNPKAVINNGASTNSDEAESAVSLPVAADKIADSLKSADNQSITKLTPVAAIDITAKNEVKKVANAPVEALTTAAETELKLPEQAISGQAPDKAPANGMLAATVTSASAKADKADKTEPKATAKGKITIAKPTDAEQGVATAKQAETATQLAEKLTPLPNGLSRSEQGFSATLSSNIANAQAAVVEARLTTASNNLTAPTVQAEQLKQSINLMQQDAAGHMRQQVSLMLSQQIQRAEIRLDPAGLGMMQIKIDMQQDQATVQFTVQQQQARELIEQQLPRLREMLQQQGIQLAEGQVQQQSQQQQQQLAQKGQQQAGAESSDDEALGMPIQVTVKQSDRLVDYYA